LARSNANRDLIGSTFERWETQPIDEWYSSEIRPAINKIKTLEQMNLIEELIREESLIMFLPRLLEYRFQLHSAWGEYEDAKRVGCQWELEEKRIGERKGEGGEEVSRIRKDPKQWGQWDHLRKLYSRLTKVSSTTVKPQYGRKAAG
jgi:hypothetical protein